ncbi:hypothetical protein BB561_004280 [Smittium simulii]|uniref:Peptidase S1 domain-containing protein n=1 Tax=Smittium simulii TaxID=133385 RepID=A0A2T9YH52_9FUNG|nr:hypothetical protein BB561_004280 [Smittium simulii]
MGTNDFDIDSSRPVDEITIHSQYNTVNQSNDIAVIRLSNRVNFKAIKIAKYPYVSDGETLRAIGWGLEKHNATTPASNLKEVDLTTISRDRCRKGFSSFQGNGVGAQICTGDTPGKDTCSGDSGGPLMRKADNGWLLVGVTSFGAWDNSIQLEATCGVEEVVGVYTNVMKYVSFISTATGLNRSIFT